MPVVVWAIIVVAALFGFTAFRGAPYVPTHRKQIETALDLLNVPPKSIVVDLGSGDGKFLLAAAQRGLVAYGYEINPLLCLVAWWRCRRYKSQVHIRWSDFLLVPLPATTQGVFLFGAGPFMKRISQKLAAHVSQHQPLLVASYGYQLPGYTSQSMRDGVWLYKVEA